MSALRNAIVRQYGKPSGLAGALAGWFMALRPSNRKRARWTLSLLDIQPMDNIFELGCGPGYALAIAAMQARRGNVTGVDHSPVMVRMARARLADAIDRGGASVLAGDESRLSAYSNALNVIYSMNVIQFLDDIDVYFALGRAALRQGGRIATTYVPRGKHPSAAQTEKMAMRCRTSMQRAGFSAIDVRLLDLRPAPAMCVLGTKP